MKKNIVLAALAAVLILVPTVNNAWAYFTTYTEARGVRTIRIGDDTEIEENVENWTKHIVVENKAGSQPVYIRAKAFGGDLSLSYTSANNKWKLGADGWYYYEDIVYGGQKTEELLVKIEGVPTKPATGSDAAGSGNGLEDGDVLDVIVIYERTPVLYDKDGKPYADWNSNLISEDEKGGTE